ncbi:MAG: hypothetical protein N2D54_12295, partial [Chloroflexota bacterium]
MPALNIVVFLGLTLLWIYEGTKKKPIYTPARAIFEGGGIKRGLTSPEAAVLLGKPFEKILTLLILNMLEKKFIEFESGHRLKIVVAPEYETRDKSLNSEKRGDLRRFAAQNNGKVLHPYEAIFLELFEQVGEKPLGEINFELTVDPFINHVAGRIGGFDLKETRGYYELIIRRAPKEARIDGVFVDDFQKVYDHNFLWLLLNENRDALFIGDGINYSPSWLDIDLDLPFLDFTNSIEEEV